MPKHSEIPPVRPLLRLDATDKQKEKADLVRFGDNLRRERLAKRMTVYELAFKASLSYQAVYHFENADNFPSIPAYRKLCRALGMPTPPLT